VPYMKFRTFFIEDFAFNLVIHVVLINCALTVYIYSEFITLQKQAIVLHKYTIKP